jgi:hypothetical protein
VTRRFTVVLAIHWRGVSVASTCDEVEAETADEAIEKAVEAWQAVRPGCTFHPLLVV